MANLMIVAGGSGGHIVPGLAIAEKWRELFPQDEISFITSGRAVERYFHGELKSYRVMELNVPPINDFKHSPWRFTRDFWRSYQAARKILKEVRPTAVIGMGAMTCVPLILSARLQQVPIFLHEQNKVAGRATRHLARFADVVFTSFNKTIGLKEGKKIICTGNPLKEQEGVNPSNSHIAPVLLVLGGSQGARHLNQAIEEMVKSHPELLTQFHVIQQTGSGYTSNDKSLAEHDHWERHEFLQPVAKYYKQASVVICRAGAGTLSELAHWGLPAILVPYPQAAQQHQLANARELQTEQAALLVEEASTPAQTAGKLWTQLQQVTQPAVSQQLKTNIRTMAKPDAASKICREVAKLIHP